MEDRSNGMAYVAVAVGAAAVGAAIGILFAPASGRETRRRISRRVGEQAETIKKQSARALRDLSERAAGAFEDSKERLGQILHS